ncbi:MAG: DNA repair protein RecN [Synechococcus sp.]
MLAGLRLHNIALIDSLELDFEPGFTVLTGETGAGKSLLLDALDAVLGGMQGTAAARLVRNGESKAGIEVRFDPSAAVNAWLQSQQLALEAELVVCREWRRQDGRLSSRFRINGVAVNRQQVLALRPFLIDLTVQGQTQQLARPGQQRHWLDRLGAPALEACLAKVRRQWLQWREAFESLEQARAQVERSQEQWEERQALLDALDSANLDDPDELRQLSAEQDRLVHGVHLQAGLGELIGRLQEGVDQAPSAMDHLLACCQALQHMQQLDGSLQPLRERCLDLEAGLRDFIRELELYGASFESEPARLEELQERLALLKRLERRHGLELAALCDLRDQLREQLSAGGVDGALAQLEMAEQVARQARDQVNQQLTGHRQQAAHALERTLLDHLRPMGMANVRFQVAINPCEPGEQGADAVQFLFSANPGLPLAPLADVASGGEMSRFLLALKTCLVGVDGSSVLLFDEIDSGVSGRVSGAMADLLRTMTARRQVFCVTHQPLVAAAADHHFRVSKTVVDGQTRSHVCQLRDIQAREQELAELAGGDLGEARAYAASLLDQRVA